MKLFRISIIAAVLVMSVSCKDDGNNANNSGDKACGDHMGNQLYKDDAGNCYYMENGKKVSVDSHDCNC